MENQQNAQKGSEFLKNTKQHSGELAKKIGFAVFMVILGSILVCVAVQNISIMLAL